MYHRNLEGRKKFIVVVSRESVYNKWSVCIGQMQNATPDLEYHSFDQTRKFMKIRTKIKADSRILWVSIPVVEIDYEDIAKEAFIEHFSLSVWNDLCARQDKTGDVSMIRDTVQDLKVHDDNPELQTRSFWGSGGSKIHFLSSSSSSPSSYSYFFIERFIENIKFHICNSMLRHPICEKELKLAI